MSENKQENKKRLKTGWLKYLLPIAILIFTIHMVLPDLATLGNTIKVLQSMSIWLVLLALLAEIVSYMGSGYLLKVLVTLGKSKFSIFRGVLIYTASSSIGLVAGGWVANAVTTHHWVLQNKDISPQEAALTAFIPNLYNYSLISVLTLLSMAYLQIINELTKLHVVLYGVVLLIAILGNLFMIYGISHREWIERFACGPLLSLIRLFKRKYDAAGIRSALDHVYGGLVMLDKRGWSKPAIGSLMNVGFDMLCLYLLFIAAGHPINVIVLIAGYGFSILIGLAAFFVPGGVGVVESGLVAIFTSLGVPAEVSVVVALSYRLFSFWIPSILGFAITGYLGRQK